MPFFKFSIHPTLTFNDSLFVNSLYIINFICNASFVFERSENIFVYFKQITRSLIFLKYFVSLSKEIVLVPGT